MKLKVRGYNELDFDGITKEGIPALRLLAHYCPRLTLNGWNGDGFVRVRLEMISFETIYEDMANNDRAQLQKLGGYGADGEYLP